MTRISILKRSTLAATAALALVSLLSPANASNQRASVSVLSNLPIRTTADHADAKATDAGSRPIVLTSRLPWLAPVGHQQPRRADAPQSEQTPAWERQQRQLDQDVDRKLIICRGC
jgi:hypothetical protein